MSKIVLKCRTNDLPEGIDDLTEYRAFTVDKEYDAERRANNLIIKNDIGESEWYTIHPDEVGLSYKTWFDLVEGDLDGR